MQYNLLDFLNSVKDNRRKEGLRFPLASFLGMVIMAIISGHQGYRGFERFFNANKYELCMTFNLKHGVPSFGTIRSIIQMIDVEDLELQFKIWMESVIVIPKENADAPSPIEWYSGDGKSIRSTVVNGGNSLQNFTFLVNIFAQSSGLTVACASFENKKAQEPVVLRELAQTLGLEGGILTLDAIHCKKKH